MMAGKLEHLTDDLCSDFLLACWLLCILSSGIHRLGGGGGGRSFVMLFFVGWGGGCKKNKHK